MDAQNENAQRVAAETINLINEGQPRIDLPPTTREIAELDVHHYDNLCVFPSRQPPLSKSISCFKAIFGIAEQWSGCFPSH